jgi:hypothetical protein
MRKEGIMGIDHELIAAPRAAGAKLLRSRRHSIEVAGIPVWL